MPIVRCLYLGLLCLLLPALVLAQDDDIECVPPPSAALPAQAWYMGQGDAHAARSQHAQALTDYTCALRIAPEDASAYARRAFAYTALGNDEAALADFEQAVNLDEALVEIYVNRGSLYARLGNFGLAIGDFTLAATLDPQNITALNNRAVIHAIEGNYDLALSDLAQALSIDPDDPQAYATRGAVYSALAAQDYQTFLIASGSDQAALPAGTPAQVLSSVDDSLRTGNFGVWLALLQRGQ